MSERPSISVFIGNREKAIHGVLGTTCMGILVEIMEDQPVFSGKIESVHVEISGPVSKEEMLIVMHALAEEFSGRTGQAAEFYLNHL